MLSPPENASWTDIREALLDDFFEVLGHFID